MTDSWGEDPEGATPLTEEQRRGLIASWVTTRADLNEAEADNIQDARRRWRRKRLSLDALDALLDHSAVSELHRDMFGDVWSWAGTYRTTNLNIGVEFWQVTEAVANLTEDAKLWIGGARSMTVDRAACRYHHRLVEIHPFPNGNGRLARDLTDLLLRVQGAEPFSWGRSSLNQIGTVRAAYISALRAADGRKYEALEAFVRS
jgi:Fic-DOC domain mobile mystery protein B